MIDLKTARTFIRLSLSISLCLSVAASPSGAQGAKSLREKAKSRFSMILEPSTKKAPGIGGGIETVPADLGTGTLSDGTPVRHVQIPATNKIDASSTASTNSTAPGRFKSDKKAIAIKRDSDVRESDVQVNDDNEHESEFGLAGKHGSGIESAGTSTNDETSYSRPRSNNRYLNRLRSRNKSTASHDKTSSIEKPETHLDSAAHHLDKAPHLESAEQHHDKSTHSDKPTHSNHPAHLEKLLSQEKMDNEEIHADAGWKPSLPGNKEISESTALPENQHTDRAAHTEPAKKKLAVAPQLPAAKPAAPPRASIGLHRLFRVKQTGNAATPAAANGKGSAATTGHTKGIAPKDSTTGDDTPSSEENALKMEEDNGPDLGGDQSNEESKSKLSAVQAQESDEHMKAGDLFFSKRDYTNAMIEYGHVVQIDDHNIKARYMLGKVLIAMSDYQEALKEFDKIIELRPRHSDAYFMRGESYRFMGKYDQAFAAYKHAIRLNKRNALAHTYLGECYRTRTWYRPAIFECHKAISIDDKLVAPHLILAECYQALDQPKSALDEYTEALKIDPNDASAHTRFARSLGELNRWEEAIVEFARGTQLDPRNAKAHEGMAWALANIKKPNEALVEARKAVALAPNDADVHSTMAWVYQKKGDHQSAVTQYKLALRLTPGNAHLHKSLGLALSDAGDVNGAIAELMTACKLMPSDYDAKMQMQALLQKHGK